MIGFITDQRYTLLGLVIGMTGFFISSDQINFEYEVGEENSKYEQQVETLNDVVKSIDTLKIFVIDQKENLKESQATLSKLKQQQDELKPVIEADQKTVDAIFAIQTEQNRKNVWWERAIGFFLGIVGSLIASLIWTYARKKA